MVFDATIDYLRGVERDELIKVWGEPDRTDTNENEDVWILNEEEILIISYTANDRLEDADIES